MQTLDIIPIRECRVSHYTDPRSIFALCPFQLPIAPVEQDLARGFYRGPVDGLSRLYVRLPTWAFCVHLYIESGVTGK